MKIEIQQGIIVAQDILKRIKSKIKDIDGTLIVGNYRNGREQGYGFNVGLKKNMKYRDVVEREADDGHVVERKVDDGPMKKTREVTFWVAENRNSDQIVVYEDPKHYYGELSTVAYYRKNKYFKYNEREKAAVFIANRLKHFERKYDIY